MLILHCLHLVAAPATMMLDLKIFYPDPACSAFSSNAYNYDAGFKKK